MPERAARALRALFAALALQSCLAAGTARAEEDLYASMRFTQARVEGLRAPACGETCPDVLLARGQIDHTTPWRFGVALHWLAGRKVPIVLTSPGGYVAGAESLGAAFRRNGFSVIVADARIRPGRDGGLPVARLLTGGFCASACPLAFAGGVQRLLAPRARIGVHQGHIAPSRTLDVMNAIAGRTEADARTESESLTLAMLKEHLTAMGVDVAFAEAYRLAPPSGMHWPSRGELEGWRLLTPEAEADADARALLRSLR